MKRYIFLLCFLAVGGAAQTSTPVNPASQAARQWRQQHERAIVDEFVSLLAIPNFAADRADIRRNAETIARMMEKRGIAAKLVSVPGGNPVVFGEIKTPGATRTIVFYAHYDGQPLDPKEWATPPFTPTLRDKQLERDGQVIPLPAAGKPFDLSGACTRAARRMIKRRSSRCWRRWMRSAPRGSRRDLTSSLPSKGRRKPAR